MNIRSTAKAIIVHNGKVLLNKCFDKQNGEYHSLPGGGQHPRETLHEAVIRECLEETGYEVIPKNFVALYEEICDNPEIEKLYPDYVHKMYHVFYCELKNELVKKPTEIDEMQVSCEWIEVKNLDNIKILPEPINQNITKLIKNKAPMYLGSDKIYYNHG